VIVLDTHTWVWWTDGDQRLSPAAETAIESSHGVVVSSISAWEVATLERLGRLRLKPDLRSWIRRALAVDNVVKEDVTPEVAVIAGSLLPPFPGDPADRIIFATALTRDAALVTADRRLARHDPQRVIW
jgi:PIN domain nuclease of toxin-antitoxin system